MLKSEGKGLSFIVTGCLSLILGRWSLVTGFWPSVVLSEYAKFTRDLNNSALKIVK
jgi:hypothetical protein